MASRKAQNQAELKVEPKGGGFALGEAQPQTSTARLQQMDSLAVERNMGSPEFNLCSAVWYRDQIPFLTCKLEISITHVL